MKLRKGKRRYILKVAIGEILHAHVNTSTGKNRNPLYALRMLRPENMPSDRKRGTPTHFAIARGYTGPELLVYPTPDDSAEIVIRYYPPAEEI